jgi:5'-nucleotidase
VAVKKLRILVTNDDGVESPGIQALAAAVSDLGHDVLVVAPLDDQSGVGSARAAMAGRPVRTKVLDSGFIGIGGTPALAVTLARLGAFGPPPDLVVSGINHGINIGVSIFHSGTVAAALTAASQGMSGLAMSIGSEHPRFLETAGAIAAEATRWLVTAPTGTVLSVNVPDVPAAELQGVRWARLAPISRSRLAAEIAPTGEPVIVLNTPAEPPEPDTDEALLSAGYATVTSLTGVRDLPDQSAARQLQARWNGRPEL